MLRIRLLMKTIIRISNQDALSKDNLLRIWCELGVIYLTNEKSMYDLLGTVSSLLSWCPTMCDSQ